MTARRWAAALACAVPSAWLLPATAAHASQEPAVERTAWYSAASGGGLVAPQPTTAEDDLRVARAVETSAFSVLLFRGEGVRGSLVVSLREGSATGMPDLVACPTVGTDWEAGANQPADAAPEVDCAASTGFGVPSDDGLSIEFGIDAAFQVEPGTWSIALVPTPRAVAPGPPPAAPLPFSVDIVAPEPGSLVLEEELGVDRAPAPPPAEGAPPASAPGTGFGFAPDPGAGFGAVPDSGSADAPALDPAVAAAPLSAPLAAPQTGAAPVTLPPPLQATPAGVVEDLGAGRRLLALLVLAGGSAAVGYAAGQQRPGPRLIGGRARALGTPALAVGGGPSGQDRPRGIGRFAKVRETAPRRLR